MERLFLRNICYFGYVYTLLWLSWKSYSISVYNGQNHIGFMKKSIAFVVPPAYSRYRGLCTRGWKIGWFCVNFPRDLKCQNLSSLTVEIAFKRCKQTIKYQCWCGVNFPRDLKCQVLSSLTLKIAFKGRKEANIYIYIHIFFIVVFVLRNQNNLKLSRKLSL